MFALFGSVPFTLLCFYLLLMSLVSFTLFGIDKARAKRKAWRIPERVLLLTVFLGGAPGAWIGMQVFHHKTMHRMFTIGVPVALLLWIAVLVLVTLRCTGINGLR